MTQNISNNALTTKIHKRRKCKELSGKLIGKVVVLVYFWNVLIENLLKINQLGIPFV